jgi:hypothetical protein
MRKLKAGLLAVYEQGLVASGSNPHMAPSTFMSRQELGAAFFSQSLGFCWEELSRSWRKKSGCQLKNPRVALSIADYLLTKDKDQHISICGCTEADENTFTSNHVLHDPSPWLPRFS